MKLKAKLVSTIAAACLVIALLVTGVWAVSTASVTLGGSISFSATNVHARIEGLITGAAETVSITPLEYDSETDEANETFVEALESWSNDLTFTDQNKIQMSITVTNLSTERSLFVKLTDNTDVTNLTDVVKKGEEAYTSGTEVELVAGTEQSKNSVTFNITLNATSTDESVEGNYAYKVDLNDVSVTPVLDSNKQARGMTFSLSTDGSNTATVTEYDDTTNVGGGVIPAQVIYQSTTYDVISIEEQAFLYSGFKSVKFPSTLRVIGSCAFGHSYDLQAVKIPEGVTIIKECAFYDIFELTVVEISSTVETIEYGAFAYCSKLATVTVNRTVPATAVCDAQAGWNAFGDASDSLKIYVPDASVEDYKAADGWKEYADKIVGISMKGA